MTTDRRARPGVALSLLLLAAVRPLPAETPEPGKASGTYSVGRVTAKITHAVAFVDASDRRKPVILVLSDRELPAADWKKESDLMHFRAKMGFNGVAFWLNAKREAFRTDYFVAEEFPTGANGLFDLKLVGGEGKSFAGTARAFPRAAKLAEPVALDAAFHAVLK